MAQEYTPTVNASAQLAAAVSAVYAPPNAADIVLSPLCSSIDATGFSSLVVKIPQPADLAAASAATYGTALSSNNDLAFDTAASMTIVEGAAARGILLDTALSVELRNAGFGAVDQVMQFGTLEQKLAVAGPEIQRLIGACVEKFEADHCALTTSPSNSVGTTVQALTVDDLFSAIYTFDTLESPTRERALLLWAVQMRDLRASLATANGGLGGAAWFQADISAVLNARQLPTNGALGTFLGIPIYQGSHSLRTLSDTSTNVNGMLFAIGRGDPYKGGKIGYVCNAMRRSGAGTPWSIRMINDPDHRGTKVTVVMEYNAIEFRDTMAVRIKTKAT